MPHATSANITERYGDDYLLVIADRDDDDFVDSDAVDLALSDATEHINGHLAARYDLPLASVPAVLVRLCVDIACYWLGQDGFGGSELRRQRFDDANKTLEKIAAGKIVLLVGDTDGDGTEDEAGPKSEGALITSETRLFSRTTLSGF